jgi:hypothetical protein
MTCTNQQQRSWFTRRKRRRYCPKTATTTTTTTTIVLVVLEMVLVFITMMTMMLMMMASRCNAFSTVLTIAKTTAARRDYYRGGSYSTTCATCLDMAGVRTRGLEKRREGPSPSGTKKQPTKSIDGIVELEPWIIIVESFHCPFSGVFDRSVRNCLFHILLSSVLTFLLHCLRFCLFSLRYQRET